MLLDKCLNTVHKKDSYHFWFGYMERNYCCTITYSNKLPIGRPQIIGFSPCLILWLALFWPSQLYNFLQCLPYSWCALLRCCIFVVYVWNLKPQGSGECTTTLLRDVQNDSQLILRLGFCCCYKKRLTSITQVTKIEITNFLCHFFSVKSTVLFWWLLFGHDMLCLRSLCSQSRTFKCGMLREITLCINPQSPN